MKHFWVILALVVVATVSLMSVSVRQHLGWIDSVSGSQKSQTVWRFGVASTPAASESLLAARYRKLGVQWVPDWKNVEGTYIDIFGRSVGHAHGSAPEINSFASSPELQQRYLAASSDDEVRKFFRVMSSGTVEEKKAAVEAACNKALGEPALNQ